MENIMTGKDVIGQAEVPSTEMSQVIRERLIEATRDGNTDDLSSIIKEELGIEIKDYHCEDGSTLLHLSVTHGSSGTTRVVASAGVDVNAVNNIGQTALHIASSTGRLGTVETLLAIANVDDTIKDSLNKTAMDLAKTRQVEAAFQYARSCFIASKTSQLFAAVQKGNAPLLRQCMDSNRARSLVDVNATDSSGETILHKAIKTGKSELVQACLGLGCDPFGKNRKGKLPIEVAQTNEIKQLLIEAPVIGSPELSVIADGKLTGYLLKYINFASGYKRRFVVLDDGVLSYFKSEADYPVHCKGSLNVQFARLVCPPGDRLSFELRTSKYSLYFRAERQQEASKWVLALGRWQRRIAQQEDKAAEQQPAIMAADILHRRSQTSMADQCEYKSTLSAAHECLDQLTLSLSPSSGMEGSQSSTAHGNSVSHLLQSLQEFFRLCDEREDYWQDRFNSEVRQRAMIEESLRKYIKQSNTGGMQDSDSIKSRSLDEEFYDAFDETLKITATMSDDASSEFEDDDTIATNLSEPIIPRTPSAERLEELRIPELAIPAEDLKFIEMALKGYPSLRRDRIPVESSKIPPISIWNIIKNAIGKDLTRIPVPINFSEPLSMLQRLCEDLEYADLLYMASIAEDPLMRLQYVAAFAVSPYSSTDGRVSKPFNPMLGETFEYASHEHGFRYISEQVSHHPPISACHCESSRYIYYAEVFVKTKFWKSLELVPDGLNHVYLKATDEHFSYRKVTTAVYNLIMGKMWLDHYGTLVVVNHKTGDVAEIEFKPTGWRTSDPRRLEGKIVDADGEERYRLEGYWHRYLRSTEVKSGEIRELWRKRALPPWSSDIYNFTYFAATMNECPPELIPLLPQTDARLRPDQRAMEDGLFEDANDIKLVLEDRQRARRKQNDAIPNFEHIPRWFKRSLDKDSGEEFWEYLGGYWESREKENSWSPSNIFMTESSSASSLEDEKGEGTSSEKSNS